MEKIMTAVSIFLLTSISGYCQSNETPQVDRNHMFSANASFTPGYLFRENTFHYYLQGTFSYFASPQISIQGDAAFSFRQTNIQGYVPLKYHSGFLGACYHFTENGNLDPYIGLQAGFSFLERTYPPAIGNPWPTRVSEIIPNTSIVGGLNFYVNRYFNIFANLRYVYGQPSKSIQENDGLHEIRFSFGLGFNFAQWQQN
jgi:hypothetical protein